MYILDSCLIVLICCFPNVKVEESFSNVALSCNEITGEQCIQAIICDLCAGYGSYIQLSLCVMLKVVLRQLTCLSGS